MSWCLGGYSCLFIRVGVMRQTVVVISITNDLELHPLVLRLGHRELGEGAEVIQQLHVAGRGPPSPQAQTSRRPAAATPPRRARAVEKRG